MDKKFLGGVLICIALVLAIIAAIQLKYFNKYTTIGIVAMSCTAILCIVAAYIFGKYGRGDERKDGMLYYFNKVNEFLAARPEGDIVNWAGDSRIRIIRKSFSDKSGKNHEYIGMVGTLKMYKKFVVVIYSIDLDDIYAFYGDPPSQRIIDPFYKFDPHNTNQQMYGDYLKTMGNKSNEKIALHLGGSGGQGTSSLSDKASSVLKEIDGNAK